MRCYGRETLVARNRSFGELIMLRLTIMNFSINLHAAELDR